MTNSELRKEIIAHACEFASGGLSVGKSGNISVRFEQGFLITPTGFSYEDLQPQHIAYCDLEGALLEGSYQPSSEWPFHAAIYKARQDIQAIVHCHSAYATALATTRRSIPPFHYMVAIAGGNRIECAEYATFGSTELSVNAVKALGERKACLLANHGQITVGKTVAEAYALAGEVESLAKQYCLSLQFGEPVLLDDREMQINLEKFSHYGQQQKRD